MNNARVVKIDKPYIWLDRPWFKSGDLGRYDEDYLIKIVKCPVKDGNDFKYTFENFSERLPKIGDVMEVQYNEEKRFIVPDEVEKEYNDVWDRLTALS